jgi:hypothetical protein
LFRDEWLYKKQQKRRKKNGASVGQHEIRPDKNRDVGVLSVACKR